MNPLLWLNAVAVPSLLAGAFLFKDQLLLAAPMAFGIVIVPGWTLWEYSRFARKDPQRLHSEEYLIEQQRLMVQSKSSREPMDAALLPTGSNPELLEGSGEAGSEPGATGEQAPIPKLRDTDDE
jgi:hypothetical protein